MTRFWKPRSLPAVIWNPKKDMPFFEFSPEGFCDTDNQAVIEYMRKCGYVELTPKQVAESDIFIAEQMKKRGMDQTGFVQSVPSPDESETSEEHFQPVAGGEGQAVDAPHPIPEVKAVPGGNAPSEVPMPPTFDDDVEDVPEPAAKPKKKAATTKRKTVTRRKKKE
jgi:hypothetical protein